MKTGTFGASVAVLKRTWNHPANRTNRIVAVLRAVRFQLRGRILRKRTLATIGDHSKLWAELHYTSSALVLYSNPPDWNEMRCWTRSLRPGSLFVDVGANIGAYTIYMHELGAEVVAIEPDPGAARRLRENLALNGYGAEVLETAIADKEGVVRFSSGLDALNHLELGDGGVDVAVTTLDAVLGDRTAGGVKIDVEGAELLVLKGASRALAARRIEVLQLEWNQRSVELLGSDRSPVAELLLSYKYRLYRPDADGRLLPFDGRGFGADVFAIPEELAPQ